MLSTVERIEGAIRALSILERRAQEDADELRARRIELEEIRDGLLLEEQVA